MEGKTGRLQWLLDGEELRLLDDTMELARLDLDGTGLPKSRFSEFGKHHIADFLDAAG